MITMLIKISAINYSEPIKMPLASFSMVAGLAYRQKSQP
jgi:hypothetical protein